MATPTKKETVATVSEPKLVKAHLESIYEAYLGKSFKINVNGDVREIKIGENTIPEAHADRLQKIKNNVVMSK